MPRQLPTFASQAASGHSCRARRVELFDDIRQKQNLPRLEVDHLGDVGVGLRLALWP
ncbi:hypothetical protein D3C87_1997920 [compost metagenome]